MLDRKDVIDLMAKAEEQTNGMVREKILAILRLCEKYRYLGKRFTFDASEELDAQVNHLLIQLSDALIDLAEEDILDIVDEEDSDAVLAYVHRDINGDNLTERTDRYATQLRHFLEAYIAILFARKTPQERLFEYIWNNIRDPWNAQIYRAAMNDPLFLSWAVTNGGLHYGRGRYNDVLSGITLLTQDTINTAFQYGKIASYRRDPNIIGYTVHRGSTYDCQECDELCVGVHSLFEIVLPAHPRCMCYTIPVYSKD